MKFRIDERIFEKFDGLVVGVVVAKGINNAGASEEILNSIKEQGNEIRAKYNTEALSQHPKIDVWRKAYSAFGAKPKENRSSVESLYRMVLKGAELRHINKLVDIYNFISLKHVLPAGGEDIERTNGDIVLAFAGPNEPPVLLLGDKEPRPPHEGEVIYKDDISAICRRWNWREADRTKLTEETKKCVLVIEGLPPAGKAEIESAMNELKDMVRRFCGGETAYFILDKEHPEIEA